MRIAMICASVSRQGAGVAGAVEGLSGALAGRGHDVHVFALEDPGWAQDALEWRGAPVTVFPVQGPSALGYAPGLLPALRAYLPDVGHLHGLWMHTARDAQRWSQASGRPFMISPHGMLAPAALAFSKGKKRLARLFYQDRAFTGAAGYHATSELEAQQVRDFGLTQPVALYPNGIDLADRPADVPREKTILSLGRLHPVKGLDTLIEAWALLETRYPAWRLRIVGPDSDGYADALRRRSAAAGLQRVSIEGPVYGPEKFRLLAAAGLFVLPSRTENFGLTVVESLMMGTPVIASQGTPWQTLVQRGCGNWVEGTPRAFAAAMEHLLSIPDDTRAEMGAAGRTWVTDTFSWQRVAAQAEQAYSEMVIAAAASTG